MDNDNPYQSPHEIVDEARPAKSRTSTLWTIPAAFFFGLGILLAVPGVGMTFGGPYNALRIAMTSDNPFQYGLFWDGVIAFPLGVCLSIASGLLIAIGRKMMHTDWRSVAVLFAWLLVVTIAGGLVVGLVRFFIFPLGHG